MTPRHEVSKEKDRLSRGNRPIIFSSNMQGPMAGRKRRSVSQTRLPSIQDSKHSDMQASRCQSTLSCSWSKVWTGCYTTHAERCIVHIQTKPCAARSNSRWRKWSWSVVTRPNGSCLSRLFASIDYHRTIRRSRIAVKLLNITQANCFAR